METARIALVGHLGPLARATSGVLEGRGQKVLELEHPHPPEHLRAPAPSHIILFPYPPSAAVSAAKGWERDLRYLDSILEWALRQGVRRVLLRSHAIAYGASFKNYGLLEEDRVSLLPSSSCDQRWLHCEARLGDRMAGRASPSTAILRLTNILDPGEGDFVTRMLTGRIAFPAAGYDPRVQFLSLEDAAEGLAGAAISEAPGLFNLTSEGTVSLRRALRAATGLRIPVGQALQRPVRTSLWKMGLAGQPGEVVEQIRYNFTVSAQRAQSGFSFKSHVTSAAALKDFLEKTGRGRPDRIGDGHDDFGLDPEYLATWARWFSFLQRIYWRVEAEGLENVPATGAAIVVSNHRGFMPFDGVMHRCLVAQARQRQIRWLVIPSLFKFPFLSDFLIKQGGVVASQQNSTRLLLREELVGIFPEGINGAFRLYRGAYRLGAMGRDAYARLAIENQVPIIPAATIGHVEIFPILAKVRWPRLTSWLGWPFVPITATFPLLPLPLPTKWHIRYLEPVRVDHLRPEEAQNRKTVRELSRQVKESLQRNIDEMLTRRKHIFFGRIFSDQTMDADSIPKEK